MALKALIITYYWPPAGGSGVQRWLYFVKYLREFGVEPIVFTASNAKYPIMDASLQKQIPDGIEVITQKIWEPGSRNNKKNTASSGFLAKKPSLLQRLKLYIRANYFIPDARMFWINPSAKKIIKYIKNNQVDIIITTGPPHSVHLIGKKVKEKTNIKWLADFRDPWVEIDYFHHLPLSKSNKNKHLLLETEVLKKADIVTVVSKTMQEKYAKVQPNCHVITNGYDDIELSKKPEMDKPFTMTHIGMLNSDRNPLLFWEVIAELVDENEDFEQNIQINLVGTIADEVRNSIRSFELERFVNYTQYLPNHAIAPFQLKSQLLLLIVNNVPSAKNIITGKVYEYLRAKRPILAIAPTDGDLAEIINDTKSGIIVDFDNKEGLRESILKYFELFRKNKLKIQSKGIEKYHRKNLTKQLSELLFN